MKITVIQNQVKEKISDSLKSVNELLIKSGISNTDFIVLPEMFTTPYELKYLKENAGKDTSLILSFLKNIALKYNCYVIGGTIPFKENNKIYNRMYVFNRFGEIITKYDKIHLFEVTYSNQKHFKESDILTKGNEIITFKTEFGEMGVMICFDIRFPRLAEKIADKGAKVIFVPAAFNTFTGPLHWRTTFRARAIDNQLYLVGCSPSRNSYGNYLTYGHSLLVNPYGEVLNEMNEQPGYFTMNINLDLIQEARKRIPILANRVDLE